MAAPRRRGWRTRGAAGTAATVACALVAVGSDVGRARAESAAPGGLRGLLHTKSADVAGRGVFEWGAFSSVHTLDDSTGGTTLFLVAPLQMSYGLSRNLEVGFAVPVRAWTTWGGTRTPGVPEGQGGFGDIEAAAKLRLPIPGNVVRFGMYGDVAFVTGSRSRAFSRGEVSGAFGGLFTLDFSGMENFPSTRLHFNGAYRWNQTQTGFGLAPPNDPRRGGFWPPAAAPLLTGGNARDNDQILWRGAIEFSTRVVTLFTEVALDDSPYLEGTQSSDQPWLLVPGALVKFRNGINLKGAVEISLQDSDPPPTLPRLPDWRFTLGFTWRSELTFGDDDHDGINNNVDQCVDGAEDFDGFQDEDGCPDPDNDSDGVPDRRDLAPNLAEDRDGFEDQDGRPDMDDDADGIRDADDQCPRDAEDFDGDADTDGCPDGPAVPQPEGSAPKPGSGTGDAQG
jgi:hypothetical protein